MLPQEATKIVMMKAIYSTTLPLLTAVCLLSFPCVTRAQRLGTNPLPAEITYGSVTNGIRAGIAVPREGQKPVEGISVFVTNSNPGEVFQVDHHGTNYLKLLLEKVGNNDWLYHMATNSFCGPIELCDVKGRTLRLLKPEVSRPEAYPPRYSISTEEVNFLHRYRAYLGPGIFPVPVFADRSFSELVKLNPTEYFDLKEPGEYRLTVWPKIYKRMSKTNDLCERIDLPPVTLAIKWGGQP